MAQHRKEKKLKEPPAKARVFRPRHKRRRIKRIPQYNGAILALIA